MDQISGTTIRAARALINYIQLRPFIQKSLAKGIEVSPKSESRVCLSLSAANTREQLIQALVCDDPDDDLRFVSFLDLAQPLLFRNREGASTAFENQRLVKGLPRWGYS